MAMLNYDSGSRQHGGARSGATQRPRRRFAAWLLLGWVAFWFTTMAQAACALDVMPKPLGGNTVVQGYVSAVTPAFPLSQCPEALSGHDFTAAPVLLAATAIVVADRFEPIAPALVAGETRVAPQPAGRLVAVPTAAAPPSQIALYLRNQRFLI